MSQAAPLPDVFRRQVRALVASGGERSAVVRLGISRQTLARAIAGLPLTAGTHALIRQNIDRGETK